MAYDPESSPRRGGGDSFGRVLSGLDSIRQQVADMQANMATRDDLKTLVTQAEFAATRRADTDRFSDHAARITNTEQAVGTLRDQMHAIELADVARNGRTTATALQGANAAGTTAINQVSRLKDVLLGAFVSGFFSLLVFILGFIATHH